MHNLRTLIYILLAVGYASFAAHSSGAETRLKFLHALQENRYADVALEYIDTLESQSDLPADVREILDLERCNCYLTWAKAAPNAKVAEERQGRAEAYLKKFLEQNPNNPRASMAVAFWGGISLDRGRQLVGRMRRAETDAEKAKLREEANATLGDAVERFEKAAALGREWLKLNAESSAAEKPSGKKKGSGASDRMEAEAALADSCFKAGLANYYLSELCEDPKSADRRNQLKTAGKYFDEVYQILRNTNSDACLFAHLWHAKVLEELGDSTTAQDILEEVLANAPETDKGDSPLSALYSDASAFLLRRTAKEKPDQYAKEAAKWLQAHKAWAKTPAYQGVVVDLARAQLAQAKQAEGDARAKLMKQIADDLAAVAKTEGEFKEDAAYLRRQALKELGAADSGIGESLAQGDDAFAAQNLDEAEKFYREALKAATEGKDAKKVRDAQMRINRVLYSRALALHKSGKLDEALKAAGQIAREDVSDPSASYAAQLALSAAIALFAKDKDPDAFTRLESIVTFLAKKWEGKPEADDAYVTLGQACLLKNDTEGAMAAFRHVSSASRKYATILLIVGQTHWKTYIDEKKKEDSARNQELMKAERAKAVQCFEQAVSRLQNTLQADASESAQQLSEARSALGEMYIENAEYRKAVDLMRPAIEKAKSMKTQAVDKGTLRAVLTSVRGQIALGEAKQAVETALVLVDAVQDQPAFNATLVNFVKLVHQELKKAEAVLVDTPKEQAKERQDAYAKRDGLKELLVKLVEPLLKRSNYSLQDLMYLGDLSMTLGLEEQAVAQYQKIVKKAESDPEFAKTAERAMIRVRSQLVAVLRTQGQFQEALKQSEELIAKNPKALEPKMAKAQILEEWAKKEPDKYEAAAAQWTEVRVLLGRLAQKPPEYYQSVYHAANCLFQQWETKKKIRSLVQAEQVLKSVVVLESKAIDPDLFAQYKQLLKRIEADRQKLVKELEAKEKTQKGAKKK